MRSFSFRLPVLVAILWAGIGSMVCALGYHGGAIETAYVLPTTTTVALPTSYVVSSSWVEPTAYVLPSYYTTAYVLPSYYTTAYWTNPVAVAPTSYISTTRVRTGLLGRTRLIERSAITSYGTTYLPTTYIAPAYRVRSYVPTAYIPTAAAYPVAWETAPLIPPECVCPEVVTPAAPPRATAPSTTVPRTGGGARSVESEPTYEAPVPSNVPPPPTGSAPAAGRDNTPPTPPAPGPVPPAGQQQGGQGRQGSDQTGTPKAVQQPTTNPNAPGAASPPTAPGGPNELVPLPPADTRHEAQRPVYSRTTRSAFRNVLFGIVQSRASGEPEEGVRITLTNPFDPTFSKATSTDAFGRFAVRLADGDWTVNVTMPSGRVYAVSQLRVNNGEITDSQGRRIPSLEITR